MLEKIRKSGKKSEISCAIGKYLFLSHLTFLSVIIRFLPLAWLFLKKFEHVITAIVSYRPFLLAQNRF